LNWPMTCPRKWKNVLLCFLVEKMFEMASQHPIRMSNDSNTLVADRNAGSGVV
jgi:hypothetical protein